MDLEIDTNQPLILRIVVVFPSISIGILVLRLYSRYLSRRFGIGMLDMYLSIRAFPVNLHLLTGLFLCSR